MQFICEESEKPCTKNEGKQTMDCLHTESLHAVMVIHACMGFISMRELDTERDRNAIETD